MNYMKKGFIEKLEKLDTVEKRMDEILRTYRILNEAIMDVWQDCNPYNRILADAYENDYNETEFRKSLELLNIGDAISRHNVMVLYRVLKNFGKLEILKKGCE